jgi:hypothetical protein
MSASFRCEEITEVTRGIGSLISIVMEIASWAMLQGGS